ncbi:MAG: guanylate kinase [Flavobacteriales bacterium]|nr:guanylate kinase [Flavobacteriales bacterium]MCB9200673.1 guanylate kinase [Flavobacteriales bacterium]HRW88760.1 guanylate kinase [Flavobacteriales bacterium]
MSATGKCVIFSAPSGAGKTTIVHHLLDAGLDLSFSVSATSRERRANEVDGRDYLFLSPDEFRQRIEAGDFVEWEEVYPGQFYGTLRSEVERIWAAGHHAIFDVDVVGGLRLKQEFGDRALAVFVRPPDLRTLETRLKGRNTETRESLQRRLDKAAREMRFAPRFDVEVVNNDLDLACDEAVRLVRDFLLA